MTDWLKGTSKKKIILGKVKKIFFGRIYSNILIYILIIGFTVGGTLYFTSLTGNEVVCPEATICPEQEECEEKECELDCDECPKNVVKETSFLIRCENGLIVNKSEDCIEEFPEITSPYFTTLNGVTISIDDVGVEVEDNETWITDIDYSIINQGDDPIKPVIWVKVYEIFTYEMRDSRGIKTFDHDVLDVNDWIRIKDVRILIKDPSDKKIRLEILDALPDPDDNLGGVFTELENFE